jgi:Sulfotransferase family
MSATTVTASVLRQLQEPDPVGRDAALLRMRLYRFGDDLRQYVLAEALEERLLAGTALRPATRAHVSQCLTAIRVHGRPLPFCEEVATAEGIDVATELTGRTPYAWHQTPRHGSPRLIAVIVGAPRSGTSHLFNLLARTGLFGYFTTASCWAWPVRNLHHPGRHHFTAIGDAVLTVDNKRTRIVPSLVMPGEAEDVWARAIPVYRHIAAHRYQITPARRGRAEILEASARAHACYFESPLLLAKSPFNSFRIPHTEALWGSTMRYIHIIRDRNQSADSMRRNRFEFHDGTRWLTAEQAWQLFTSAVHEHTPASRLITVTWRGLQANPDRVLARVLRWLGAREYAIRASRP